MRRCQPVKGQVDQERLAKAACKVSLQAAMPTVVSHPGAYASKRKSARSTVGELHAQAHNAWPIRLGDLVSVHRPASQDLINVWVFIESISCDIHCIGRHILQHPSGCSPWSFGLVRPGILQTDGWVTALSKLHMVSLQQMMSTAVRAFSKSPIGSCQ